MCLVLGLLCFEANQNSPLCDCAGDVLPVGGVLLAESFIEPLSGRMVRVGGASIRAGQLVPVAGSYQTLLVNMVSLHPFHRISKTVWIFQ